MKVEKNEALRRQGADVPAAECAVLQAITMMAVSPGTVAERLQKAFDRHLMPLRLYRMPAPIKDKWRSIEKRLTSRKRHPMEVKDGVSPAWATSRRMHWKTSHQIAKDLVELHSLLQREHELSS